MSLPSSTFLVLNACLLQVFKISPKSKQVKFGLVIENFENYEAITDEEFDDQLRKADIRVVWHPEGKKEVVNEGHVSIYRLEELAHLSYK